VSTTGLGAWDDGYVVDVAYTEPLFDYLCPAALSLSTVLHGQPPLPHDDGLRWLDLGSGSGASACMVAAANPDIELWGVDFNPAHIERARSLAAEAGLAGTCRFVEASFAALAADDRLGPPEVDVVVVNGVYSWISRANQVHIGEIVRRRLRPGGIVFVSYAVPTGWSAMTPIAEALHQRAQADGRRSDVAFTEAAAELHRLADAGALAFPLPDVEAGTFRNLRSTDPRYAAHEYGGAHFRPLMFPEVVEVMAAGRCSYVGSIDPTDVLSKLGPSALVELADSTTDEAIREMVRDLSVQRALRRDLFRRGLATSTAVVQEGWLRDLTLIGLDKPLTDGDRVPVPVGTASLDADFYEPLVDLLTERPITVADLLALHPTLSFPDAIGSLALLVGGGYAAPEVAGWRDGVTMHRARRLNEVLIEENRRGGDHRNLVSPATGGALASEYVEMLTLGAVWSGVGRDIDRLTRHVVEQLRLQRRQVREDGALVEDPALETAIVAKRVANALRRVDGLFRAHGIC
jgi:predicted O-methyltransferase YrrM